LIEGLSRLGIAVDMVTPKILTPVYTATRLLFNEALRWRQFRGNVTIGIDADGYSIAGRRGGPPHVACVKGVIGDAVPFEGGWTRASMGFQAKLEAKHSQRADLVITVSRYCAARIEEMYGVSGAVVVPELINLGAWRELFQANPASPDPRKYTILSVCRFYPRKRLDVLLRAAALVRESIPELELRIIGNGPQRGRLLDICRDLDLTPVVRWLGDASMNTLAEEYNRADVFCLPSSQEGFGIVFLEAMAAGKPIVGTRAAAVPEVVRSGILVEPDDPEAMAEAILRYYRDPDLRYRMGEAGRADVRQFDMNRVAAQFLAEISKVAPALNALPIASLPAL
jgi:glycosyltransferase involved in cell wall biosynthesis